MSRRAWSHRPIQRAAAAVVGKYTGKDAERLLAARTYQLTHAAELVAKAEAKRAQKAARRKGGAR